MRHLADLITSTPQVDHHVACPVARGTDLSHPDPVGLLRSAGATVHPVAMSRRLADPANLRAIRQLSQLVDELAPNVVHAHASVAGALARLAARRRVPVVWSPHAVQTSRLALTVERTLAPLTDVVVALSPSERDAIQDGKLAAGKKIRLIVNGIATASAVPGRVHRESWGVPQGAPVVGFIGRFCAQKAPGDFVAAVAQVLAALPEAQAVCVGSGPLLDQVLALADALPAGRFHHVTCDSGAEQLLSGFDVLVMPSRYEGGPYLPLEAMHAGVPVVASSCVGLRDYVIDHVSGLSVEVGDVDGLAAATLRLLTDVALRDQLVASARAFVRDHHALGAMSQAYQGLYSEVGAALPEAPLRRTATVTPPSFGRPQGQLVR